MLLSPTESAVKDVGAVGGCKSNVAVVTLKSELLLPIVRVARTVAPGLDDATTRTATVSPGLTVPDVEVNAPSLMAKLPPVTEIGVGALMFATISTSEVISIAGDAAI